MAGDAEFAGPEGFLPYFEILRSHADAYVPINEQILADWGASRTRLLRLRDVAQEHLWPNLHNDWLPALTSGSMTGADFEHRINRAVRTSPFDRFLDSRPIQTVFGVIPAAIGVAITATGAAGAVAAGLEGIQAAGAVAATAAIGAAVHEGLKSQIPRKREDDPLTTFYQQANRAIS
jgi:hypothetical protein